MSLDLPPHEVTRRANELIIADQRSRMFATTFVGYISLDSGEIEFSSGGHNPALVYRAASNTCEYIMASGVAVGIFKGAEFMLEAARLEVGDILVLYTDGITEAINIEEEEFGEDRLAALVIGNARRPAQLIADLVLDAVTAFAGDQDLFDDATLVIVKRTGEKP
jgi:sigma-B regulation protein RsbU (phosphoserine phosphatase)